jgi:hypothetical protein
MSLGEISWKGAYVFAKFRVKLCFLLHFSTILPYSLSLVKIPRAFIKFSLEVLMFSKDLQSFHVF